MLSNLDSQKIILREHFQTEEAEQRRYSNVYYAYLKKNKQRNNTQTRQKSSDKENSQKQIDLDFMKVNSLALAKKGSFKVSYFEDFTIDFKKSNKSFIQSSKIANSTNQNRLSPLTKMSQFKNIVINRSPSLTSSQNEIIQKIKTEGSYRNIDLSQGSSEGINQLFNQQTVQIYQPTSPSSSSQLHSFNQSVNNLNSNVNLSNLPSCKNTTPCNSKIIELNLGTGQNEFLPLITRKKGRSLPPLKLKQYTQCVNSHLNPTQELLNNNTQISKIQPFKLNTVKKYSYLFDSYNLAQDKVVNNQNNTLLLEEDPEYSNVQMIFNHQNSKPMKAYNNLKEISEQLLETQNKLALKPKTTKKQNSLIKKKPSQQESVNIEQRYSDIQCVPFKSYKFDPLNNKNEVLIRGVRKLQK